MPRAKIVELRRESWVTMNGPCAMCGTWDYLEVDHIYPDTKSFEIGDIWGWADDEARDKELAKCQVLCQLCHKEKTARDREEGVQHGTLHMYNSLKYKCRCLECCTAYAAYQKQYRANKKNSDTVNTKGTAISSKRKLTDEQIREIRNSPFKYNRGYLARLYDVNEKTIGNILRGLSYTNVV